MTTEELREEIESARAIANMAYEEAMNIRVVLSETEAWTDWLRSVINSDQDALDAIMLTREWKDWDAKTKTADTAYAKMVALQRELEEIEAFTPA